MTEKIQEQLFFRYVETNDHEGETWSVFIPFPETEEEQKNVHALESAITLIEQGESENEFLIYKDEDGDLVTYSDSLVNELLDENNFSRCNYLREYSKGNIVPDFASFAKKTIFDPCSAEEMLCKMAIIVITD